MLLEFIQSDIKISLPLIAIIILNYLMFFNNHFIKNVDIYIIFYFR